MGREALIKPGLFTRLFSSTEARHRVGLIIVFLLAALIRRDDVRAPGHLIEREYNSAIFARAFYFEGNGQVDAWERDIARITRNQLPLLEPPVTEYLVSLIYRMVGREELWYARYLTSAFWLIGGIFLYRLSRRLTSPDGAMLALAYYLFVPMGVLISRSFQPDSLMMMMFLISLDSIVSQAEAPSWRRLLLASTLAGVTVLLRPLVVFALLGAFVAVVFQRSANRWRTIGQQLLVFCILGLGLAALFYGYGIYVAGLLEGQASLSFRPYLLTRVAFWAGWLELAARVITYPTLIVSIFGFSLFGRGLAKQLVTGLLAGYALFGLSFTYHIHTHPYYHIQLFAVVGLCIAALVSEVRHPVMRALGKHWWLPVGASLMILLFASHREVKGSLYKAVFEDPHVAREIGDSVGHSSRTVFVAYHYGLPLRYYGEFAGAPWPVKIDDPFYRQPSAGELTVEERIAGLGFEPEYFIITHFGDFERRHQDLRTYLVRHCTVVAESTSYLIFGRCVGGTAGHEAIVRS